jgi:hypothetical protein
MDLLVRLAGTETGQRKDLGHSRAVVPRAACCEGRMQPQCMMSLTLTLLLFTADWACRSNNMHFNARSDIP